MMRQMERLVALRGRQVDAARAELKAAHQAYDLLLEQLEDERHALGCHSADALEQRQALRDAGFAKLFALRAVIEQCEASLMLARREHRQAEMLLDKHRERHTAGVLRKERRAVDDWLQARHEQKSEST